MTATSQKALYRPRSARPKHRINPARVSQRLGFCVLLTVFVAGSLFPFYWIVITSLKTPGELAEGTTNLLPGHVTWSAYVNVLTRQDFLRPLLNSLITCLSATAVTVIIAALAGYALSRTRMRGKPLVLGFILLAGFFPIMAMVGPMFTAYRDLDLLNTYPALIISYLIYTLPIATWLLSSYFSQIPKELEEAALVDGCTRLQTLRRVIMPVALPGVFTAAILSFILAWNDFTLALSFMTSTNMYTAPVAIVNLGQSQFQVFYNLIDAAVVIISLPIALLVILAQKRIVSGLTAGSFR
jgi:ABC-type glycerol-3-phosphate transport system permease component